MWAFISFPIGALPGSVFTIIILHKVVRDRLENMGRGYGIRWVIHAEEFAIANFVFSPLLYFLGWLFGMLFVGLAYWMFGVSSFVMVFVVLMIAATIPPLIFVFWLFSCHLAISLLSSVQFYQACVQ